jgi:hypothetical protein
VALKRCVRRWKARRLLLLAPAVNKLELEPRREEHSEETGSATATPTPTAVPTSPAAGSPLRPRTPLRPHELAAMATSRNFARVSAFVAGATPTVGPTVGA